MQTSRKNIYFSNNDLLEVAIHFVEALRSIQQKIVPKTKVPPKKLFPAQLESEHNMRE